jgi:hypothetical protein
LRLCALGCWTFVRVFFGATATVALENGALRHQLMVRHRSVSRPRLQRPDRICWGWLTRLGAGWRSSLLIVQPAIVLAWQRQGFQLYGRWRSRPATIGRPMMAPQLRSLLRRLARENPTWGRRLLQADRHVLGYDVGKLTVAKSMRRASPRPSPTWRAFLEIHLREIVASDCFDACPQEQASPPL